MTTTIENQGRRGHVLLFYKYVEIQDPELMAQQQRELCERLNLTGKMILAREGINATLAGDDKSLTDEYKRELCERFEVFKDVEFKESEGLNGRDDFDSMSIRVSEEIITTQFTKDLTQLRNAPMGVHLSPVDFHQSIQQQLEQNPDSTVILDVRNFYESRIGKFENAICPQIRYFGQFAEYVDENLTQFQNKNVYMYCTGGIRCERASQYMRLRGVENVYQLHGGIHKYCEELQDNSLFKGKNYVFDNRGYLKATDDILSQCDICKETPNDQYRFCSSNGCRTLVIACDECLEKNEGKAYCCDDCRIHGPKYLKILKRQRNILKYNTSQKSSNK